MHHQVPAVVVPVAQHARLGGQLRGHSRPLDAERGAFSRSQTCPSVPFQEVLDEEIQLPRELFDVERQAIRSDRAVGQFGATPLEAHQELHGPAVVLRVRVRAARTEMRLERLVAEILQRQDPEGIGMPEDGRHGQRHAAEQVRHLDEG